MGLQVSSSKATTLGIHILGMYVYVSVYVYAHGYISMNSYEHGCWCREPSLSPLKWEFADKQREVMRMIYVVMG